MPGDYEKGPFGARAYVHYFWFFLLTPEPALPSLQTLIMEQTNLKDLVSFRGGFKELRRLSIRNCLVDGRHFECVAALPTLLELFLDGTGLEVEDLLPLRGAHCFNFRLFLTSCRMWIAAYIDLSQPRA